MGILRGNGDAVGPRRAPDQEGREVVRVGGHSSSETPSEGEEPVSNVSACSSVAATDMNNREASAEGARWESIIEGGCSPEEAGEAGDILCIGVRPQSAHGGDHPLISEKLRVAEAGDTEYLLVTAPASDPAH